jgi:hypothetical protein
MGSVSPLGLLEGCATGTSASAWSWAMARAPEARGEVAKAARIKFLQVFYQLLEG